MYYVYIYNIYIYIDDRFIDNTQIYACMHLSLSLYIYIYTHLTVFTCIYTLLKFSSSRRKGEGCEVCKRKQWCHGNHESAWNAALRPININHTVADHAYGQIHSFIHHSIRNDFRDGRIFKGFKTARLYSFVHVFHIKNPLWIFSGRQGRKRQDFAFTTRKWSNSI